MASVFPDSISNPIWHRLGSAFPKPIDVPTQDPREVRQGSQGHLFRYPVSYTCTNQMMSAKLIRRDGREVMFLEDLRALKSQRVARYKPDTYLCG